MKICLAVMLAAAAFLGARPGALAAETVTVENNTGFPICEFYLSPAAAERWAADVLGGLCFQPGETRALELDLAQEVYDVLIIADNHLSRNYYGLDLGLHRHVRLNIADADLFEWNPSAEP